MSKHTDRAPLALVYTTTTGNTAWVAELLAKQFARVDVLDAAACPLKDLEGYANLIFCVSSWGRSEMQDNWETLAPALASLDLRGRKVGVLGLGDQKHYPDAFADGMKRMAQVLRGCGATLYGRTSLEGYTFRKSLAVEQGMFLGCVIDEETQSGLTEERLANWAATLRHDFGL